MIVELDTPALLIDRDLLDANIAALMARLRPSGVRVRPHLKTAKCPEIARILVAAGASGFCVAKLGEAEVLAAVGIDDLLITGPIAGAPKLRRLAALRAAHPRVRVVVDSVAGATLLNDACADTPVPLEVLIELDVGQGRCGVTPGAPALALARALQELPRLRLVGLQGYEGHLQHLADPEEQARRVDAAMGHLTATTALLRDDGHAIETVTTGGTGTCERCAAHPAVTEVQPGSFIFLDRAYPYVLTYPWTDRSRKPVANQRAVERLTNGHHPYQAADLRDGAPHDRSAARAAPLQPSPAAGHPG